MTLQPLSEGSVLLFLSPKDLSLYHTSPQRLTQSQAYHLSYLAFAQSGLTLQRPVEIEAFPDPLGVLIFIHFRPPQWAQFASLQDLLPLLPQLPFGSCLVYLADTFWLALPGPLPQGLTLTPPPPLTMPHITFTPTALHTLAHFWA